MLQISSPNFDSRGEQAIDMLVLHYTGMKTAQAALDRMCCDTEAKVSAHYMVDEYGKIFQLVDEKMRAWHAGISYWRGNTNINQRSIGIEIANKGHEFGYTEFPKVQMEAVASLCLDIINRHNIQAQNVVGHSDIAPTRKQDPGELFDWKFLAKKGVGLFPNVASSTHYPPYTLHQYGYDTSNLPKAIAAFQRHFRPNNISKIWDEECAELLATLIAKNAD